MRPLLLLLAVATIPLNAGDLVLKFERGSLQALVSSEDAAHPEVQGSSFVLVSCRTTNPATVGFTLKVTYLRDGKEGSLEAKVPRLPDGLLLPPSGPSQLIAEAPWTPFRFFLPTGATIKSVSVEERVEPSTFEIPTGS